MTKSVLVFILMAITFQIHSQCPNIVWADEFSGTSLDQAKWNYQIGDGCAEGICGWGNNELQSYQQENVTVNNGSLKITALKKRVRGSQYTSGRINSKGKGDFTYGRFEARVKLPAGDGLWPAFWMLSTNEPYGGWPQSGEIDIMEFTSSNPDHIYGTMHYGDPYPNNQFQGNGYYLLGGLFPDDFHEFAIEWEANEIRWYVDNILYSTKTSADVSPYSWPFDQDFHFLLNVAVGGNLGGPVDNGIFPATMEVDYVRVYDGFKVSIGGDRVVSNQATGITYSLANLPNGTNVSWSVPAGASIASGQGSSQITVNFGSTSGAVSATFNNGCESQTLSLGVEVEYPYLKAFSFENFDEPGSATLSSTTGTLTEVANPGPSGVNTSALSGNYVRNSSEQYDLLVYTTSAIANADNYSTKAKKFFMDVYTSAPVGTSVLIQLETASATPTNYPAGRHSRYVANTTTTNTWERLQFSLLDQPDGAAAGTDVGTMIVLFNSNSLTGDTYVFDNLDSYNADTGAGSNLAPQVTITNPADQAAFTANSTVTISANATDSDGTISQVEFFADGISLSVDTSAPYSVDWVIGEGTFSLSAIATDNLGATATNNISVIGQASTGQATSVHVESIVIGSASAGKGNKYATASITILDDLGNPVSGASVTGTFSGTFNETVNGTTNASGVTALTTAGSAKGSLSVNICVAGVTASLPYASGDNLVTCTNGSARMASFDNVLTEEKSAFQVYPNPVTHYLNLNLDAFEDAIFISILDLSGRTLFHSTKKLDRINMNSFQKGVYIIEVQDGVLTERRTIIK